jgi:hypothetical protein
VSKRSALRADGSHLDDAHSTRGEWDLKDPYYRQCVHPQPGRALVYGMRLLGNTRGF